jgi:cyclohexa-1,5-dienecarbonyl-CoA hydratase
VNPGVAEAAVLATLEADATLLRLALNRPKGNVLDVEMIKELRAAIARHAPSPALRCIVFEGRGPHFSFGASVEEHRDATAETMLTTFHGLFHDLMDCGKVLVAAVRGQCLGGGLELAAFCHRVIAAPGARFGSPEIRLGVFAPAASFLLPVRIGQPRADDLLLTGRILEDSEAVEIGLVDQIADDPSRAASEWHEKHLVPLSAAALSHAVRAARHRMHIEFRSALLVLERQYLDELSLTSDAREGIAAFLEKRPPSWKHR